MVSMMIADDELMIRQGLLTLPWKEYGIEVIGAASNGEEALHLAKAAKPQILLTDIRMPGMDGLALVEAIKGEVPDLKAILLTGYQDFAYAHSAIQLGAMGYVLKPSDPDEIINIVLKAKKQIEEEMKARLEKQQILQKVDRVMPAVFNSFLQDLLFGRITDRQVIAERCKEFSQTFDNYVVMLIELKSDSKKSNVESISKVKEEICSTTSAFSKSIVLDIQKSTCCIINELSSDEENVKDKLLALAMEIRNTLKSEFDIYVSIGISRCCHSAADMHVAFNQAMNCLKMRFSLGKGAIIHIEDLKDSVQRQNLEVLKMTEEIFENIKTGNYRMVEKTTREMLFRLSKEQKAEEQIIKSVCFDILVSSYRILKEEKTAESMDINEQQLLSRLTACTDVEELEEYVIQVLMGIMDSICAKVPSARNKIVLESIDYIEKFYMEDISLLTLSEHVHMNHIYISRLIKRETGETFLDILTNIRMKKASELLSNSDYKTYEISYKVGIKDSGYFSQVFKKYYGVTPSEYRENLYSRFRESAKRKGYEDEGSRE